MDMRPPRLAPPAAWSSLVLGTAPGGGSIEALTGKPGVVSAATAVVMPAA